MSFPAMPPRCKQDVVDLLHMVQTGECSCRKAARLLFPQFQYQRLNGTEVEAYSYDEMRVVDYIKEVAPDIGAGFDPIGFLIASHRVGQQTRNAQYREGLSVAAGIAGAFANGQRQMMEEEGSDEGLVAGEFTALAIRNAILRRAAKRNTYDVEFPEHERIGTSGSETQGE